MITTALTLRAVCRLPLRQTEGLLGSLVPLLGIDLAVPDPSTISRRARMPSRDLMPSHPDNANVAVDRGSPSIPPPLPGCRCGSVAKEIDTMFPIPTCLFLTSGVGVHRHQLTAFEFALRDADIEQQNIVSVSSILPPRCQLIPRAAGVDTLRPGEITFCVMARAETSEPGRRVHASIGLARPADPAMYGYISEHHGFGMTAQESGDYAEDLAATMLASTLGIDFDPEAAWNERKRVYETSQMIIDSLSITAAAEGDADGRWTCVVALAVFRFDAPASGKAP